MPKPSPHRVARKVEAWAVVDRSGEIWTYRGQAAIAFLPEQITAVWQNIVGSQEYYGEIVPITITFSSITKKGKKK